MQSLVSRFVLALLAVIAALLAMILTVLLARDPFENPCAQYPMDDMSPKCAPQPRAKPGIYWSVPTRNDRLGT